jgi:hypothetical protein
MPTRLSARPLASAPGWPLRLLFVAGAALLLLATVGGRGPAEMPVELPLRVARALNPGFLATDLGALGLDYYGRQAWIRLLAWTTALAPLPALLAWLYYVELLVTLGGMYHLTLTLSRGRDAAAMLATGLLAMYPHPFLLGSSAIFGRQFYEAYLSAGLLFWASSFALRNRPWPALVITGLATNLHFLQGVQTLGLLLVLFLLEPAPAGSPGRARRLVRLLPPLLAALACAAPEIGGTLPGIWESLRGGGECVDTAAVIRIMGRLRYGHHFIPTQMEPIAYLGTAIILWAGVAAGLAWTPTPEKRRAVVLLALLVACCVIVAPLIELHHLFLYLDVFRSFKFALALALALAATFLADSLVEGRLRPLLAAAVAASWHVPMLAGAAHVILLPAAAWRRPEERRRLYWAIAAGVPLVGLTLLLPDWPHEVWRWRGVFRCDSVAVYLAWVLGAALAALLTRWVAVRRVLLGAGVFALAVGGVWLARDPLAYDAPHPEQALLDWVRDNTPADARLITPPTELSEFRAFAGRAVLAEMWIGPLRPALALEWYARLDALSGGQLRAHEAELAATRWTTARPRMRRIIADGFHDLTRAQLQALGRRYEIRWAVVPADMTLELPIAFRGTRFNVVRLDAP